MHLFARAVAVAVVTLSLFAGSQVRAEPGAGVSDFERAMATICLPLIRDGASFDDLLARAGVDTSRTGPAGGILFGVSGLVQVAYPVGPNRACDVRMLAKADTPLPAQLTPSRIREEVLAFAKRNGFSPGAAVAPTEVFAHQDSLCTAEPYDTKAIALSTTADERPRGRIVVAAFVKHRHRPIGC